MKQLIMNLIEKWYKSKLSPEKINDYFDQLEMGDQSNRNKDSIKLGEDSKENDSEVRVACVQRQISLVSSVEEYIDQLYQFVKEAEADNCQLIIFPEYIFFDLFGLIPGFKLLDKFLNKKSVKKDNKEVDYSLVKENSEDEARHGSSRGNSFLRGIFASISDPVESALRLIMARLAVIFDIYIYSGSYILKEDDDLYNAGSLFGPTGECIGTQKKLHFTDFETDLGFTKGEELKAYSLPFGKVVFPICMDATYFETLQISRELGADMVILPIANMEEYSQWRAQRGIWARVQESYLFGLKSSLNGRIAGMHFTGKAGIFAPLEMTKDDTGVISLAPHYEGDYLVVDSININKCKKCQENTVYFGDRNPAYERNYIDRTYQKRG